MAVDECAKRKRLNIKASLKKLYEAGKAALARAICQALRTVAQTAAAFLTTQLLLITTFVDLQIVYIDNFIVKPLTVLSDTVNGVSDKIGKPLNAVGIDKKCSGHKKVHKAVDTATRKLDTVGRRLKNRKNRAEAWVAKRRQEIAEIEDAIESLNDLASIDCSGGA